MIPNNIHIATSKDLLDHSFVHEFICNSYWGKERTMQQTLKTIESSFCFGMYSENNNQIGFARLVTDFTFFGYFMDIIIAESHQGRGLSKVLIEFMLNHEIVRGLQTVALKTKDAHSLYEKFGFERVGDSPMWMSIDRQKLD